MKKIFTVIAALFLFAGGYAQVPVHGQNISAVEARDLALSMTGGGAISSLELVSEDSIGPVYRIVVINNNVMYEISVSARTGDIFRLTSSGQVPAAPQTAAPSAAPTQQGGIVIGTVRPRRAARFGGPANPPISAQRAVEIARDHLVAIGVTHARFDYVYMDRERGLWVWSVEFDGRGRDYEFYIDVNTGAIVQFEIGN
ncbi:MAG: PepSY domain-containing protein [Treponema sp.]|nr:PepSY domain-containing protein [Treponema sp.]